MDNNEYLGVFLDESHEHLQSLNENVLLLEKSRDDKDIINEIFRSAHTLKGMAGTMGFSKMSSVTHKMENVLDLIRNGKLEATESIIDSIFECLDVLESIVDNIESIQEEGEVFVDELVEKLLAIQEGRDVESSDDDNDNAEVDDESDEESDGGIELDNYTKAALFKAIDQGLKACQMKVVVEEGCVMKAVRAYMVFKEIEETFESDIVKSLPSAEEIENNDYGDEFYVLFVTEHDIDEIAKKVGEIVEISSVSVKLIDDKDLGDMSMDVSSEEADEQEQVEIAEEPKEQELIQETVEIKEEVKAQKVAEAKKAKPESKKADTKKKTGAINKTVRVDINKLDNLMNLVSELIIIKTRLHDITVIENVSGLRDSVEYLERITTSLHNSVMNVRMVPIEKTFSRFPRMVRDTSKKLGKQVKFITSGEETELDRTIIDEIGDPLLHIVRNSLDHGLEMPEERAAAGKSDMGTLEMHAYQEGNSVFIECSDDGGGINVEKVKQKAIDKGLITEHEAQEMNDDEAVDLLFRAGFSTAQQLSDLSGRGVGLDVVKTTIESLGGNVSVKTELGKGSVFTIRLPLTLAIVQALMMRSGSEIYAMPLDTVESVETIEKSTIHQVTGKDVVVFRNKTIPIYRLCELLEVPDAMEETEELTVVMAKKGNKTVGVVVDSLIGQQEIVIKTLKAELKRSKLVSGATILGNGEVALIINPAELS
ncbi:MAG: chemotaxis protein CheA [Tissierellales bacterium]|nr:chemotaxis protein CheA [Tissierellales bacterium]